jgi:hypothetical protein
MPEQVIEPSLSPPVRQSPAPPLSAWRAAELLNVEEAAYRYEIVEFRSQPQPLPLTYCLAETAVDDPFIAPVWTDPPAELMARFRDHRPPVKRMAVCRIHPDVSGVTDIETGGLAVIFRVTPPAWESDTEATVDGGYYKNGLSASGKTYRLRYQAGEWVVVDVVPRWIS